MAKKQLTEKLVLMDLVDEPAGIIRLEIDPEAIKTLAESIRALGLMQAILVRPVKDRFEVVYGHRRYLAFKLLGEAKIRATVKELDDATTAIMRAAENTEREDVSAIEEAATYKDLCDTHGFTVEQVGKRMGKSPGVIKRRIDLLRMPNCLQVAIHKKQINYGVGESLWQLADETEIEYYLQFAIDNGATVATVREWVKDAIDKRRRGDADVDGGRGWRNPMEQVPIYVACDVCKQAMELGKESVIRACPDCGKSIYKAMES